ncbi:MAG: LPS export ABC transporter periplasmic protein LptC [Spirochaetales bacterium]|nr:LPS export ABC transporter periplasmic protein LptC [Candidatus Physcosoma equi]
MKKFFLCILVLTLLSSCLFQKGEDGENRAEKAIYPDMILENARYQIGQSNDDPILMEGGKITFYAKDGYALLENFTFYQTDADGNVTIRGGADKGRIDIESRHMELEGNVSFSKESDNMRILASSLVYDSEKSEISADGSVMIESDDGIFQGSDFQGDLIESLYVFKTIEKGELTID